MEEFFKTAAKFCGPIVLPPALTYAIYSLIIKEATTLNLTKNQTYALLTTICITIFFTTIYLIKSISSKKVEQPTGGTTITITSSQVTGGVAGGHIQNSTTQENKDQGKSIDEQQ